MDDYTRLLTTIVWELARTARKATMAHGGYDIERERPFVHLAPWRATSLTPGMLVVRVDAPPDMMSIAVVVDLPGHDPDPESALERVMDMVHGPVRIHNHTPSVLAESVVVRRFGASEMVFVQHGTWVPILNLHPFDLLEGNQWVCYDRLRHVVAAFAPILSIRALEFSPNAALATLAVLNGRPEQIAFSIDPLPTTEELMNRIQDRLDRGIKQRRTSPHEGDPYRPVGVDRRQR